MMDNNRDAAPKVPDTDSQQLITEGRTLLEQWRTLVATRARLGEVLSKAELGTVRWAMAKVLWAANQLHERGWPGLAAELREKAEVVLTQACQKYQDDASAARWVEDGGQGAG